MYQSHPRYTSSSSWATALSTDTLPPCNWSSTSATKDGSRPWKTVTQSMVRAAGTNGALRFVQSPQLVCQVSLAFLDMLDTAQDIQLESNAELFNMLEGSSFTTAWHRPHKSEASLETMFSQAYGMLITALPWSGVRARLETQVSVPYTAWDDHNHLARIDALLNAHMSHTPLEIKSGAVLTSVHIAAMNRIKHALVLKRTGKDRHNLTFMLIGHRAGPLDGMDEKLKIEDDFIQALAVMAEPPSYCWVLGWRFGLFWNGEQWVVTENAVEPRDSASSPSSNQVLPCVRFTPSFGPPPNSLGIGFATQGCSVDSLEDPFERSLGLGEDQPVKMPPSLFATLAALLHQEHMSPGSGIQHDWPNAQGVVGPTPQCRRNEAYGLRRRLSDSTSPRRAQRPRFESPPTLVAPVSPRSIYQFHIAVRQQDGQMLMNHNSDVTR